jgi:DNA-binding NarL/FixJ family response regulator
MLEGVNPQRLRQGFEDASTVRSPISSEIAGRVAAMFQKPDPDVLDVNPPLTSHEVRVLRLLVDGHSYRSAGERLRVSVNTISFHMRRIYEKLDVHSKAEAVSKALRQRIVD